MNWIDPKKELPKQGKKIAVLLPSVICGHNLWPDDYEIVFGETQYHHHIYGKKTLYIESNFVGGIDITDALAWCYAKEFDKPGVL